MNMEQVMIRKKLHQNRQFALVLYALGQTPSYNEELSSELCISQLVLKKILNQLMKYDLIEHLDNCGIPQEILPVIYEKCNKISPSDPLYALDTLEFYSITKKGLKYLSHAKEIIFKGGGNRERK
jgi:hypothetical protein